MSLMLKKHYLIYGGIFLLALAFFIVGLFYDLEYAKVIYNKNIFGVMLAALGETPAYGGMGFIAGGLYSYQKKINDKKYKILLIFASVVLLVVGVFLSMRAIKSTNALNIPDMWYVSLPIALLLDVGLAILGYDLTSKTENKNIFKVLVFMAVVIFLELAAITILKKVWGRPRYRFLISSNDYMQYYRNWWEIHSGVKDLFPNVSSDNFKSCPSGHTGSAACAFLIVLLPQFSDKLKGKETILLIIAAVWTFLVGFSRHLMGAHFITDTTFAMMITMIISAICYYFFFMMKKNKKVEG